MSRGSAWTHPASRPTAHGGCACTGGRTTRTIPAAPDSSPCLPYNFGLFAVRSSAAPLPATMALIVHKYGSTSMGSVERIQNVARRVAKWRAAGHRMVVVPSAMSGETNRLIALAREIQPQPDPRELDMIASTGEQVSVGLLAMALKALGTDAISYTGWQVPVRTDGAYTKARILSIDDARIRADLDAGRVVIVTGFQGVD